MFFNVVRPGFPFSNQASHIESAINQAGFLFHNPNIMDVACSLDFGFPILDSDIRAFVDSLLFIPFNAREEFSI